MMLMTEPNRDLVDRVFTGGNTRQESVPRTRNGAADAPARSDPRTALIRNSQGVAFVTQRFYDRAIEAFTEAIGLDPLEAQFYNNRGYAKVLASIIDVAGNYQKRKRGHSWFFLPLPLFS